VEAAHQHRGLGLELYRRDFTFAYRFRAGGLSVPTLITEDFEETAIQPPQYFIIVAYRWR